MGKGVRKVKGGDKRAERNEREKRKGKEKGLRKGAEWLSGGGTQLKMSH